MKWIDLYRPVMLFAAVALVAPLATAQSAAITSVQLGNPGDPPSRLGVRKGDTLRLVAPTETAGARWFKDGLSMQDTGNRILTLTNVSEAQQGAYTYSSQPAAGPLGNQIEVTLLEEPAAHLSNYSSRMIIAPGSTVRICGFVVDGKTTKSLLVRAVGESLRPFGIANPVKSPRIQLYKGQTPFGFTIPGVVLSPDYWARLFANSGAFPLTGNEEAFLAYGTGAFGPGAYTLHVSDESKLGGEVLVEIYEITVPTPYN